MTTMPLAGPGATTGAILRRSVGLPLLTLYGIGTTVGAGIFALLGKVAARADGHVALAFLAALLLVVPTAVSFARLAARLPKASGEVAYVHAAFGRRWLSVTVGWLAAAAGVVAAAAILSGAAGYASHFIGLSRPLLVVLLSVPVQGIALIGIKESAVAAAAISVLEVGTLLVISALGAGSVAAESLVPPMPAIGSFWGIVGAASLAFFALLGFEDMVYLSEEVHDSPRTMPRAMMASLTLAAIIYVAVGSVAVASVPLPALASSPAPLALVLETVLGRGGQTVAAAGVVATLNGALVQTIKASRILFGIARDHRLCASLAYVHPRTQTPVPATLLVAAIVTALGALVPIETLAEATTAVILLVFAFANAALLVLERRDAGSGAGRRGLVPALGLLLSVAFLALEVSRKLAG
ncbi:MAG: amino acid permease [Alphaproteobacteria bacterium]|nr:amino acid permease [Alphaproteobacteria bacterium]